MPADAQVIEAEVGGSLIAGRGLRATGEIAEGAAVVRYPAPPTSVDDLGPVNHSCDPNLAWGDDTTLVARHALAAGAELTFDYSTVLADPQFVLWCHCETYRCRQVIEGTDWQIPQLQLRYAELWHPAVQQRIDAAAG